jgi:malic enzyme
MASKSKNGFNPSGSSDKVLDLSEKSLAYHSRFPAGKLDISPTKPCRNREDLSLAYTPGVAYPGIDYFVPSPFDPRLLPEVASAVAEAAMEDKVARKPIADFKRYRESLTK